MISLNIPIGCDGFELLHTIGVDDQAIAQIAVKDQLNRLLRRLQPAERAALVAVRSGEIDVDEAARRLGKTRLATTRLLNSAARKAAGRKRRSGVPAPNAGVECPIGTVTIRRKNDSKARFIKIRMAGKNRWKLYARHLWEQTHGPIPEGKQVLHADGDSLNDDPSNLVLGGHADRAFLFQSRSDENFRKAMSACREGCRRHNRERAIARDLTGDLRPWKWYAVDHEARQIIGPLGQRSIASAFASFNVQPPAGSPACSPKPWIASQLGWPAESSMAAIILAVLAARPEHVWTRNQIGELAEVLTERLGRPIKATSTWMNQALQLAIGRGNACRLAKGKFQIARSAIDTRGPVVMHAFLRGRQCLNLKENGYLVQPLKSYSKAS